MKVRLRWTAEVWRDDEREPMLFAEGNRAEECAVADLAKHVDGMVEQAVWAISKAFPKGVTE